MNDDQLKIRRTLIQEGPVSEPAPAPATQKGLPEDMGVTISTVGGGGGSGRVLGVVGGGSPGGVMSVAEYDSMDDLMIKEMGRRERRLRDTNAEEAVIMVSSGWQEQFISRSGVRVMIDNPGYSKVRVRLFIEEV